MAAGPRVGMASQRWEGGNFSVLVFLRCWEAFVLVLSSQKHFNNAGKIRDFPLGLRDLSRSLGII